MEFTSTEQSIVRNMMLSKSFREIAFVLESDIDDVSDYINNIVAGTGIVTYQSKLDAAKASRPARTLRGPGKKPAKHPATEIKAAAEKRKEKQEKETNDRHRRDHQHALETNRRAARQRIPTLVVDYTALVSVRIDSKTIIMAKPGQEAEAKAKFLKNYTKPIDRY